ncbi:MAG: hypothetical protein WBG43_04415 [Marinifilaceae bacterium]
MSKEISASEFIELISEYSDEVIEISEVVVTEELLVKDSFPKNGLVLKNCEFKKHFILENVDLFIGIKIIDCNFHKSLSFNDCKATDYNHEFNFTYAHINISNSNIKGLFFNGDNEIERGVKIYDKTNIKILQVESIKSVNGGFSINNSDIGECFDIRNSLFSEGISITENSTVRTMIRFEFIEANSIVFQKSLFEGIINLFSGNEVSLCFEDSEFHNDVNIIAVPISSLTIVGSDFKDSFKIKNEDKTNSVIGSVDTIYLSSNKFRNRFLLEDDNINISKFHIVFSRQFEGECYLKSCNILETIITGDNHSGNLVFNSCRLKNLKIDDFNNYSNLSLISVKEYDKDSIFSICNTNLGKTQLFNTSLGDFKQIIISNSILLDVLTANVTWFADNQLFTGDNSEREYVQIREVYRQLKYSSEKEGNKISLLKFKALELQAYRKELNSKHSWFCRLFRNDTYLMWAGMTNNNGQSWFKPVLLAVIFGVIIHFLMIVGISTNLEYGFNFSSYSWLMTWSEYCEYFKTFPQVMNPTHILKRVFGNEIDISAPVYFLDYLLRIVIAFFIFQVITAFRKYMK